MDEKVRARKIVEEMFNKDSYSKWLGIECELIEVGRCILSMTVRKEMLNGFGLAHGSITYALADSALAFASNSYGRKCLSIDTQISHILPVEENDILTAESREINRSNKLARYEVSIRKNLNEVVAHFIGTVYIKKDFWEI